MNLKRTFYENCHLLKKVWKRDEIFTENTDSQYEKDLTLVSL